MLYTEYEQIIKEEYADFLSSNGLNGPGELNEAIVKEPERVISVCEERHTDKIRRIADTIVSSGRRTVFISGPSSSGKTTFASRLESLLEAKGRQTVTVSMDDYYLENEKMPLNMFGRPDFEAFDSIDHERLNLDIASLHRGEKTALPGFDFVTHERLPNARTEQLDGNGILVVEGIHGLNPSVGTGIPGEESFRVFCCAVNAYSLNGINSSNTRLMRRMVRDFYHRAADYALTFRLWDGVEMGSRQNIYPYAPNADSWFNSACAYEYSLYRKHLDRILPKDPEGMEYAEGVKRLRSLIADFTDLDDALVPEGSVLQEFLERK